MRFALALSLVLVGCGSTSIEADGGNDSGTEPNDAGLTDSGVDAGAPDSGVDAGQPLDAGIAPVEVVTIQRFIDPCLSVPPDYGTYGPVTRYNRYEVPNPEWIVAGPLPVQVLAPIGGAASHPVILYAHPFGGSDWEGARAQLEFLVSHDYVVVFAPYPTATDTVCGRADTLWGGLKVAVQKLAAATGMDTTRVGVSGHSFGGGQASWIAHEAYVKQGWGANGLFVLSMAPWYTYRMEAAQWAELPTTARLLMLNFRDDTINDHRIGIAAQFTPWRGPREYLLLNAGSKGSCTLPADHGVPATRTLNGLDVWGVWRHEQALAACVLRGQPAACEVVDGQTDAETLMGQWLADSTPFPRAEATDAPTPSNPESSYTFKVSSPLPCGAPH